MPRSGMLRAGDWRAIRDMTGEARELGDEPFLWRDHWLGRLSRLVDAPLGHFGEMEVGADCRPRDIGVAIWGYQEGFVTLEAAGRALAEFREENDHFGSLRDYLRLRRRDDGACLERRAVVEDGIWYRSPDYLIVQQAFGVDPVLYCFRAIEGARPEELSGIILNRARGAREFGDRERAVVKEAHDALAPHIGRSLARFREPSPLDLAVRVRQVLARVLEGDSDKQIAARLGLSPHTINQYMKAIYRHFRVESRPQLLSRWLRRGWGARFAWNDPNPRAPYAATNGRRAAGA